MTARDRSAVEGEQCLGKVLAVLSWGGWAVKPSEILIGIHSLLCYFSQASFGHCGFIPGNEDLELGFLVQNAFFDLLE